VRLVALSPIVGVGVAVGVGEAADVVVDVVGVSSWVNPGMAVDNFCTPRPFAVELPPELDKPGAAMADSAVMPDDVEGAGLDTAPAKESDVVDVVVAVLDAVEVWDVESLLRVCVAVFSTDVEVPRVVEAVGVVGDVVVPLS
jgi:hypothetical protein